MKIENCKFLCLLPILLLTGCEGCRDSTPASGPVGPESTVKSGQYHDQLLTYAIENLNRLEEFDSTDALQQILRRLKARDRKELEPADQTDPLLAAWPEPEMLGQIVDRLNQWLRAQQPPADWKLDPMVSTLPKPLADLQQVKNIGRMEFSRFDGYALQETVWLRDIGLCSRGDALDDLERAKNLFDWTVRNIQIEVGNAHRIPQFPWETLLFGQGTASERAWVFILLARQLGIDAALLAIDEGRGERGEGRGMGTSVPIEPDSGRLVMSSKSKIPNPKSQIPNHSPRPWCVGVLIEGGVYLFDPALGLPIPAPNGVKRGENGQLAIHPATLAQVVADEKLLRAMDADEKHVYSVKASDLKHVIVMLDCSPTYLARRMKLLESRLVGAQKMVLAISPSTQAEHWKAAAHVAAVRLWTRPFETIERRANLDWRSVQMRLAALVPFYGMPSAPLLRGRVLHLKGKFIGDDGATRFYQMARPSNAEVLASSAHVVEKTLFLQGKQDASYWLGLIAYQRGNYQAAADYFIKRTLEFMPNGPWTNGARYNLARTIEAVGETERAILQYQNNDRSPGYPGDLLRAKWLKQESGQK